MSSRRPAASASAVRCRSSGDGVGSPDGWLWTRMIARGVEPDGVAIELADPDEARADVALVDGRDAQDGVLRVEQDDPQLLALEAAHLEDQPLGHVAGRPDRPAPGRPVGQQAPAELERGAQLGGPGRADPGDRRELGVRRARQAGQPVVPGERLLGQVDGVHPPGAGAPHERDQLGRVEPARAAQGEPLARPLGLGQLAQCPAGPAASQPDRRRAGRMDWSSRTSGCRPRTGGGRRIDDGRQVDGGRQPPSWRPGVPNPEQRSPPIPPPSGAGNTTNPTERGSPADHHRLHRDSPGAVAERDLGARQEFESGTRTGTQPRPRLNPGTGRSGSAGSR